MAERPVSYSSRWKRRLFSTDLHPTNVIKDKQRLRAYQGRRLLLTALGFVLGLAGGGFALSHEGNWSPTWEFAVAAPAVGGFVVALVFVLVPLHEIVRVIVAGVFAVWLVSIAWRTELELLVAMIVGAIISIGLSGALKRARNVMRGTTIGFRNAWFVGLALVGVLLAQVTSPEPVGAQDDTAPCTNSVVTLSGNGTSQTFGANEADPMVIRVQGDEVELTVGGSASFDRGTVFVRLVDVAVLPRVTPGNPVGTVVWTGEVNRGRIEGEKIVIGRTGRTYSLVSQAGQVDLGVVAGLATYRATISDGLESCTIDLSVRIEAEASSTVAGMASLVTMAVGGGVALWSILAESWRVLRRVEPRSVEYKSGSNLAEGSFEFLVRLQLEEKELDEKEMRFGDIRLRNLVSLRLSGDIRGSGVDFELPITISTDPDAAMRVIDRFGCFELLSRERMVAWVGVRLPLENGPPHVELLHGPYVGARPLEIDIRKPELSGEGSSLERSAPSELEVGP